MISYCTATINWGIFLKPEKEIGIASSTCVCDDWWSPAGASCGQNQHCVPGWMRFRCRFWSWTVVKGTRASIWTSTLTGTCLNVLFINSVALHNTFHIETGFWANASALSENIFIEGKTTEIVVVIFVIMTNTKGCRAVLTSRLAILEARTWVGTSGRLVVAVKSAVWIRDRTIVSATLASFFTIFCAFISKTQITRLKSIILYMVSNCLTGFEISLEVSLTCNFEPLC